AFTLGVTAGALIRRTVPAMAVTLAVFAAVQIAMPLWIRPHLFPARHTVVAVTSLRSVSLQQGGLNGATFSLATGRLPGQPGAWPDHSFRWPLSFATMGRLVPDLPGSSSATGGDVLSTPAPVLPRELAATLLRDVWGTAAGAIRPLDSERDVNLLIGNRYVLK